MTILCVKRCCLLLLQPTPLWAFGTRLGTQASASPVDFCEGLKWSRGRAQPSHAAFSNITPGVGGCIFCRAL